MKRGADRQLSKDDGPDDELEVHQIIPKSSALITFKQEVQTGFQMAKESDLAKREYALAFP
jgi:hypothetical protein